MSTVLLQVGQCGNQIGNDFWTIVNVDRADKIGKIYTHPDGHLRSVNVDSEPKVLHKLITVNKLSVRPENIQKGRRGRGTNWALGYYGTKYEEEDKLLESTIDSIRKEIERCSSFTGIMMMHSISGGTGSGLGSRLCETLRREYGLHEMMSCVVMPHTTGESPLQHYNSLLCLATLQRYSDCVMWFHNDEILMRLQKRSIRDPDAGVSYSAMNQHIARCMAGAVLPTDTLTQKSGVSIGQEPWELIRSVCPLPANKFIHVNTMNKSKVSWESLAGSILQGAPRYDVNGKPYNSMSNLMIVRGHSADSFPHYWKTIEKKFKSVYNSVEWNPFPVEYWTARTNSLSERDSASITIASNHTKIIEHLSTILHRARQKYSARAYIHWYEKFGCESTDFEEAFNTLDDIVLNYMDVIK